MSSKNSNAANSSAEDIKRKIESEIKNDESEMMEKKAKKKCTGKEIVDLMD